jgi:hypothetical protein
MKTTPISCLALALLLNSCTPRPSQDPQKIDRLRGEAEQLIRAQSLMSYNNWALGAPSNNDSLYRAHGDLFTRENIDLVRQAKSEEPDSVQKKRLRYFERYLILEYLGKAAAPLSDRLNTEEARATVRLGNEKIPYRQIPVLLANEKLPARRAILYAATDEVLDSLNIVRRALWENSYRLARELGYRSYSSMIEELKGIPLGQMQAMAQGVLASTDSLYRALLVEMVKTYAGLDTSTFYRYDTPLLFRAARFDRYYPKPAALSTARKLLGLLQVNLDSLKNLSIDTGERPSKNPRAVCFAIDIPSDIRLSIKPSGGPDDYAALFHELGHGLHYAYTAEHAMEFKYLGEYTVTETYAFLSEYLLLNQAWLRQYSGMPVSTLKDFTKFQAFTRLYYIRRYCGKLLYEIELHDGVPSPEERYSTILARAVGYRSLPSDRKRYLADTDEHFYTATYLRGWFLEAQLNGWLTRTYGPNWFEHPGAGQFLKSLWARGDRIDGEELAALIGDAAITPDAWLAEIRDMLRFASR